MTQSQPQPNWRRAQRRAARTAKWATTMTKVRIRRLLAKTKWQLITFPGPNGGESVGIVDLMAIRKAHGAADGQLKRGDLFEIILIQIKGGSAAYPNVDEIHRLRQVAKYYRAKAVLLAHWKPGLQVELKRLKRTHSGQDFPSQMWESMDNPRDLFH